MKRFFTLLILALGFSTAATAQNSITLRFTGKNADNAYVRLDSVTVENISRGWTETICYPDTIMELSYNVGIEDVTPAAAIFGVTNVRPNPFDGTTRFDLVMPEAGDVHLRITDVNGRLVTASDENLPGGIHTCEVILRRPATYVLHASGRLGTSTAKLVNTGGGSHDGILLTGFAGGVEIRLPLKNIAAHPFQLGDVMRYTGFASYNGAVYGSQPVLQPQNESEDFVMQFDIDFTDFVSQSQTFTVDGVSFTMKLVPGGTFRMGAQRTDQYGENYDADAGSNEQPVHQVTLSSYYMGETEVTQALWYAVTGQSPIDTWNEWELWSSDYGLGNDYPAYNICWIDIPGFLTALNAATASQRGDKTFTMPTEAQWEFAARGGNLSHGYKYAGSNTVGDVAWHDGNAYYVGSSHPDYGTHVVKTKSPNELGLYDMSGNVQEWCADWYNSSYYSSSPSSNPTGPSSGNNRVLRGGSWGNYAGGCRVSSRSYWYPDPGSSDNYWDSGLFCFIAVQRSSLRIQWATSRKPRPIAGATLPMKAARR